MFRASRITIRPSLDEVRSLASQGNLVPVYAELPIDLDTPVSLFLKLSGSEPSFLLESVVGGERVARYSFLGVRMKEALVLRGNTLSRHTLTEEGLKVETSVGSGAGNADSNTDLVDALRKEMQRYRFVPRPNLPRFCGGYVGYTGYDVVRQFEKLPETASDPLNVPSAVYMLADTLVVFDHVRNHLLIIANAHLTDLSDAGISAAYDDAVARIKTIHARLDGTIAPLLPDPQAICTPTRANKSQAEYEQMVNVAKAYIKAGDIFQVVLSRRLERRTTAHPFAIYRALRMLNPSPWMFYLNIGDLVKMEHGPLRVIGASPEMHARFENGIATVRPIAGTRKRGETEEEDTALAKELLADPKECAEHVMLVDLGRNDIGRVAEYGSVHVPDLMIIENYSHVMHITSSVQGRVRTGLDAFDVLSATFPAGTLSGAPKVRAMEIIEELEDERRGIYGGCVGYFSFSGQMDTCIVIRTIVMIGDTCYLQAGAGIVADSDPTNEYHETMNKVRALILAIDAAEE
ncbi:MAG: anthranilate synthase component I [Chloroflexi bacterium]|nr:anthranilate synthase component I [Chloroflexota bacterium]